MDMKYILDCAVEMVTVNGRPFTSIDDSGFQRLIEPILNAVPSAERRAVNRRTVRDLIHKKSKKFITELSRLFDCRLLPLKLDCASRKSRRFLGINTQVLRISDSGPFIEVYSLGCVEVLDSSSGWNLKQILKNVLDKFGIDFYQVSNIHKHEILR